MNPTRYRQTNSADEMVEAMRWDGDPDREKWAWCTDPTIGWCIAEDLLTRGYELYHRTRNEWSPIQVGDWIVGDFAGDFFVCKPEVFAATYEEVE